MRRRPAPTDTTGEFPQRLRRFNLEDWPEVDYLAAWRQWCDEGQAWLDAKGRRSEWYELTRPGPVVTHAH